MQAITRVWLSSMQSARLMATAANQVDPVQKLFLDKVKEFKNANKGLDEAHKSLLEAELERLKRVYKIQDENKLSQIDHKFPSIIDVSLRDLDDSAEKRRKAAAGELVVAAKEGEQSELLDSRPVHHPPDDFHFEYPARPDEALILENGGKNAPAVPQLGEPRPDFESSLEKVTPHTLQRQFRVMFGPKMPTIDDDKSPERDLVNFPRQHQPVTTPPTRHHFIPESWFKFLEPVTGRSGAYCLTGGVLATGFSKEWILYEHHFASALSFIIIFTTAVIKYGPTLSSFFKKHIIAYDQDWDEWQQGNINILEDLKSKYQSEISKSNLIDEMYAIRKQDIDNQLVFEHRSRLHKIYNDTKRRLDFLVSTADAQRTIAQKNMVNWVIQNSIKSIGSKQENEVLDTCISGLKNMSAKHANAI